MDEKYLQALYQQGQAGFDLGTYDEFKANITSDANFRKAFYDSAQDLDLGEYSAFETQIGAKKKYGRFFSRFWRAIKAACHAFCESWKGAADI